MGKILGKYDRVMLDDHFGEQLESLLILPSWPSYHSASGATPPEIQQELDAIAEAIKLQFPSLSRLSGDDLYRLINQSWWPIKHYRLSRQTDRERQMEAYGRAIHFLSDPWGDKVGIRTTFHLRRGERGDRTSIDASVFRFFHGRQPFAWVIIWTNAFQDKPGIEVVFAEPTKAQHLVSRLLLPGVASTVLVRLA